MRVCHSILFVLVVAVVCLTAPPAIGDSTAPSPGPFSNGVSAQRGVPGSSNVSLLGTWAHGACRAVAVQGSRAYFGDGLYLRIADVGSPGSPVELGLAPLPELARAVAVVGNHAFVACGTAGMRIIDVSDPTVPFEAASFNTGGRVEDVFVTGGYAYVADGVSGIGFRIVDVSDPTAPLEVGAWTNLQYSGVFVDGDYAYLVSYSNWVTILDVSVPNAPSFVGQLGTPSRAYDIDVNGSYAYVAFGSSGVRVIDVSTPATPAEVGSFVAGDSDSYGVLVSGGYAYVADGTAGLRVLDVSDPTTPGQIAMSDWNGQSADLAINGSDLYVADFGAMRVVDVAVPSAPVDLAQLVTGGWSRGVFVRGDHAYVASAHAGLQIIDVSDPAVPTKSGSVNTDGDSWDVFVSGDYAYVADLDSGLSIANVSNPASPFQVASFVEAGTYITDVFVSGNYAYLAEDGDVNGLRVLDVSNPAAPWQVAFATVSLNSRGVHVSGDHAYLANGNGGLLVFDVSTPSLPVEVDSLNDSYWGIHGSGDHIYMRGNGVMDIFDVSAPASPVKVGTFAVDGLQSIHVNGAYAYLATSADGVRIVDIDVPSAPTGAGYFDAGGTAGIGAGVFAGGGRIYYSAPTQGLHVVQHDIPAPGLIIDINGTPSTPTIVVSVVGDVPYQSDGNGVLEFVQPLGAQEIGVSIEGPLGSLDPWVFQAPGDLSSLSLVRFSQGDGSTFTLDKRNPIASSSTVVSGNIEDLAKLDGVTTVMAADGGVGPDVNVTVNDNTSRIVLDVEGTSANATITARVVGPASFVSNGAGQVVFARDPLARDIEVQVEPTGSYPIVPWFLSGPADGSYLSRCTLSFGELATFSFDASSPLASSSTFVVGNVTDLAVLDGTSTCMVQTGGTGECVDVVLNYDVQDPTAAPEGATRVRRTRLLAATPNPFNPATTIRFELKRQERATIRIYDAAGRLVTTLLDEHRDAGLHDVSWRGTDSSGRRVATGIYYYQLTAGAFAEAKRVLMLK